SVRQSLASSTAARVSWPGYCSSLDSSRSNSVKASAVAPAKPPITSPFPSRRTFLALALTIVWPIETWPSPPITTPPPLRTVRIVVPCHEGSSADCMELNNLGNRRDVSAEPMGRKLIRVSGGAARPLIEGRRICGRTHAQRLDQAHNQGNRCRGRD